MAGSLSLDDLWEGSNRDLSKVATLDDMYLVVAELYPGSSAGKIGNHGRQIYAFTHRIQKDDWVVMPSKTKPVINIGKVTSDYHFDPKATDPYFHWRSVDWFARDIPRSTFDKDLLYSLGAFMTVCRIQRNDAEPRIKALAQAKWKKSAVPIPQSVAEGDTDIEAPLDLAEIARDTGMLFMVDMAHIAGLVDLPRLRATRPPVTHAGSGPVRAWHSPCTGSRVGGEVR